MARGIHNEWRDRSRASLHIAIYTSVSAWREEGGEDQWTINFAERHDNCQAISAAVDHGRILAGLFATYLNTRSRKCDIIKRSRSALSGLSVVTLVTRSPRVTCGTQVSTHAGRAGDRAQVRLQVILPTAAVGFARPRTAERRQSPAFLPALIAFFLRPTPRLWLAIPDACSFCHPRP